MCSSDLTAPISMMAILFGMAMGGLVASCIRAGIVLFVGAVLYNVQFNVEQWGLLLAVFFLTLTALYGLGMMLSGLFLVWGREAFHSTQLLQEPVYFVSGLNFPVASLGTLGALSISLLPLAVGLDAMRQLAFAGSSNSNGVLPPEIEALILVVMVVVFIGLSRVFLRVIEQKARIEGTLSTRGG